MGGEHTISVLHRTRRRPPAQGGDQRTPSRVQSLWLACGLGPRPSGSCDVRAFDPQVGRGAGRDARAHAGVVPAADRTPVRPAATLRGGSCGDQRVVRQHPEPARVYARGSAGVLQPRRRHRACAGGDGSHVAAVIRHWSPHGRHPDAQRRLGGGVGATPGSRPRARRPCPPSTSAGSARATHHHPASGSQ